MKITNQEFNYSFDFRFYGVKFTVDIDDSFSARYKYKNQDLNKIDRPLHYHSRNELFFVFDDALSVESDGEIHSFANSAVIIAPFVKHRSQRVSDFRILFSYEILQHTIFAKYLENISKTKAIAPIQKMIPNLSVYLDDLLNILLSSSTTSTEAVDSLLKLLFYKLFAESGINEKECTRKESYLLKIERNLNKCATPGYTVTLELLSKELNLCKKQVSRVIKEQYGKPLYALVQEKKLTVACELLTETDLSVSEIARRANFDTENYFFKQFKAAFGTTPLQYRKTHALQASS